MELNNLTQNTDTPVAFFGKVSFEEYERAYNNLNARRYCHNDMSLRKEWEQITLPERQTNGSAGYDFYLPYTTMIREESETYPTGIRIKMLPGYFLMIVPRSGLGFKYGMALDNTIGIIDSDYYDAKNEGHIMAKLHSKKPFELKEGDRFMQGIIMCHGYSINGNSNDKRTGGFGSTGL